MGQRGRLTRWDDARGFGFITPLDGGPQVFVHVSEFPRDKRRPEPLDLLTYSVGHDDRGRLHATGVGFLTPTRSRSDSWAVAGAAAHPRELPIAIAVAVLFFAVLAGLVALRVAPGFVVSLYAVLSLLLFTLYWVDKSAAQSGRWRTSEATLQLLALAGGWPGALVAQRLFRHKTRKRSFQIVFWATVGSNCLLLAVILVGFAAPPG